MDVIKLHNTLSGKKEEFKPITPGKVTMYNCGPTVYNYAHIGNLRVYVFADVLRRMFELNGYEVKQVMNITDVGHLVSDGDEGEDKMTKALLRENKPLTLESMKEVADFYAEKFKEDLQSLNIETPHEFPKASDNIPEIIALVEKLQEKGFAYKTSDGMYFDVTKFNHYGKLGQLEEEFKKKVDAQFERITANKEKHSPRDFAVWKFNNDLGWDASFGKGFPGWHIECSAMSMKYLGETFDVHTGGIDHIPVHHNNEIAQSESATGKPFAHYWLHGAFINLEGERFAKSTGNTLYLKDLGEKGIYPLAYRYLLLTGHYSTLMNFTWDAVTGAQEAVRRLVTTLATLDDGGALHTDYMKKFTAFVNDDLDTPKAIALMWELVKDDSVSGADKKATVYEFDKILGLNLKESAEKVAGMAKFSNIPPFIEKLQAERDEARRQKDFKKSDELRKALNEAGYKVEDTGESSKLSKI
jgi:cysteinyl-tRNA synthetase